MPGGLTRVAPDGRHRAHLQPGGRDQQGHVGARIRARGIDRVLAGLGAGGAANRSDGVDPVAHRREPVVAGSLRRTSRGDHASAAGRLRAPQRLPGQRERRPESSRCALCWSRSRTRAATYPGFVGDGAGRSARVSRSRAARPRRRRAARRARWRNPCAALLDCAYAVRDQLSADTWLVVGALDREILQLNGPMHDPQAVVSGALQRVMQGLLALGGLVSESMVRDLGWRFMHAGSRLSEACSCCPCSMQR